MNDKWKAGKIEPNKLLLHEPLLRMIDRLRRELLNVNNLRAPCDEHVSRALIAMAVKEADVLLANFRQRTENESVSTGVEGAHEGTTADEKGADGDYSCAVCGFGMSEPCEHWKRLQLGQDSREPEKLSNAQECKCSHSAYEHDDGRLCCSHRYSASLFCSCNQFVLAESSLSSPPPKEKL